MQQRKKNIAAFRAKAINLVNLQIRRLQNDVDCPLRQKTVKLKWTLKVINYAEWVYGLEEILNINGEQVSLKTLFEIFNPIFGIENFHYSGYFGKIRNRIKTDKKTVFEIQHQLFTKRKEETDNK